MQQNYWIKDETRQEIITKTFIPNKGNFKLSGNYYNLMDAKGLGMEISSDLEIEVEKLFSKSGFQYIVLEHNNQKELFILPNENIVEYAYRIASKIDVCKSEKEVINLLINEMN